MDFLVNLISVEGYSCGSGHSFLSANCTHVGNSYWLYEGALYALDDGINYTFISEQVIPGYGDLTSTGLKKLVVDYYDIDKAEFIPESGNKKPA